MNYFLFKLIPPRPTFAMDMTPEEHRLMGEHTMYWKKRLEAGGVIAFGPVADPKGVWGVGILRAAHATEVEEFGKNDPTILANIGFQFEFYPMPIAVHV